MESIRLKVDEQVERTEHLIGLVPPGKAEWTPEWGRNSCDLGHLLGHLLECLAGFCAVFNAMFPGRLEGVEELRGQRVNHCCAPAEALARIGAYAKVIRQGFALCADEDIRRELPTVFAAAESLATLLLGNLEHLINHKYQLFAYLKILGVPVSTRDLYQFRGEGR